MRIFPQNKTRRDVKAEAEWCFKDKRVISRGLLLRKSTLMACFFFFFFFFFFHSPFNFIAQVGIHRIHGS